jgi:hypothetical protein
MMAYPRYVSHKQVSAAKIVEVDPGADGSLTLKLDGGFDDVVFSHHEVKNKPKPETGWYLVMYDDGYVSFSPAKSFEEGYVPLRSTNDAKEADNLSNEAEGPFDDQRGPDAVEDDETDEAGADAENDHGQPIALE